MTRVSRTNPMRTQFPSQIRPRTRVDLTWPRDLNDLFLLCAGKFARPQLRRPTQSITRISDTILENVKNTPFLTVLSINIREQCSSRIIMTDKSHRELWPARSVLKGPMGSRTNQIVTEPQLPPCVVRDHRDRILKSAKTSPFFANSNFLTKREQIASSYF